VHLEVQMRRRALRVTGVADEPEHVAGWLARTGISDPAPKPAAILLQVSDISEASGLDPGSLKRAMARRSGGEGQVARALGVRPKAARP